MSVIVCNSKYDADWTCPFCLVVHPFEVQVHSCCSIEMVSMSELAREALAGMRGSLTLPGVQGPAGAAALTREVKECNLIGRHCYGSGTRCCKENGCTEDRV